MQKSCRHCQLKYDREDGFYLGSIYINYGVTALIVTASFVLLRMILGLPSNWIIGPLAAFCIIFPILFHRHARTFWLAMDLIFDPTGNSEDDQ